MDYSRFNIRIHPGHLTNEYLSYIKETNPRNYTGLKNLYNTQDSDFFTMNTLSNNSHMFIAGYFGVLFKSVVLDFNLGIILY